MIPHALLVAPRESPGLLIQPARPGPGGVTRTDRRVAPIGSGVTPTQARILGMEPRLLGVPIDELRAEFAAAAGLTRPIFVSGHQPEFFHTGVLVKTVAAATLAQRYTGGALFLAADTDTPKSGRLRVPCAVDGAWRREEIDIPGCDLRLAFEQQPYISPSEWQRFFQRVSQRTASGAHSALPAFIEGWLSADPAPAAATGSAPDLVTRFLAAHSAVLTALSCDGIVTTRMSSLTPTRGFRLFFGECVRRARDCAAAYNRAIDDYRVRHRVKTRGRPVPPLSISHERVETPFWVYRVAGPRARLWVAWTDSGPTFFADLTPIAALTTEAFEALLGLSGASAAPLVLGDGWGIRPRALALSAYVRLIVADLFIHGIGGAKYDEITEAWLDAFLGVSPAPLACISATLRLPLPVAGRGLADWRLARRALRDVRFNPQRYLPVAPADLLTERAALIDRAALLRASSPRDRVARRAVFDAIHRVNQRIVATDSAAVARLSDRAAQYQDALAQHQIAADREYFFGLHPLTALRDLAQRLQAALND